MDEDQELLQDFLVEAGEILEQLNEQLVSMEKRPNDMELLNAVFRGFHTIKGGASFLALDALVEVCHRAEDVFNILRNGERKVDTQVMDVILPVLDVLNEQFEDLRQGNEITHASAELLQQLESLSVPESEAAPPAPPVAAKKTKAAPKAKAPAKSNAAANSKADAEAQSAHSDFTDEEFEQILDVLDGKSGSDNLSAKSNGAVPATEEDITEDEFEALLDNLPGLRSGGSDKPGASVPPATKKPAAAKTAKPAKSDAQSALNDEITEEEFEALLDELHGQGKFTAINSGDSNTKPQAAQPAAPKPAPQPKAAAPKPTPKDDGMGDDGGMSSRSAQASAKQKEAAQGETTVRVDTKRLDEIMNMVGELVLVRNRMATLEATKQDEEMSKVVANLDVVTADLQTAVMKTRMQPIKKVFGRFPRVVRDLARNLKKEVNLESQGEDTDLDKNLVEALADPLIHLVRNAVDHGIEDPDEREKAGKPRVGTVILTAEQEGDHILLTIQDDGKGMDADALRAAAVRKGMMDEEAAARLEPKDCYNLIFQPGFSTKTEISDVSGRGVGMDVVKTRIVQLNGSVEVDSKKGKGSLIIIKVPLTLAIMPTLMVMLADQIFALPLASVNEIFHLDLTHTNVVDGQLVVLVRDKALPLFYLRHWLVRGGRSHPLPKEGHVVVVSMGVQRIGFVVDSLIGQEEVVIKPLGALLHGMKGLAGATITGDGRISLILDIPGLMQTYARKIA